MAVGNLHQFNPDESEKTVDEWRDLVSEKRVPVSLVLFLGSKRKYRCHEKGDKAGDKTSLNPSKEGLVS